MHRSNSPIWLLALTAGMRRGELLGLGWKDVDLEAGILHARQTVGILRGQIEIKPHTRSRRRLSPRYESTSLARMSAGCRWEPFGSTMTL
ncbi:MAG TPA: hypothetical protein VFE42_31650 [Chloroflexota bacterium]|nr:hypothetical protein [Chloroflexota bacterium]HZS92027.1 hypothetical protein [Chloroflexota bacterium]